MYNIKLNISPRQKQIIIGKLLGDACLETANNKTYRLKLEHSYKQKEYVDWLYQELKNLVASEPKIKYQTVMGMVYKKYWFNSRSSSSFRFYAQQFYCDKKKIVPKLIHRFLTPLTLAIWFMDDGSIKSSTHKARIINTQGFTKLEVNRLIKLLADKFNLKSKLRKDGNGYQIMILGESANDFAKIIKPFVLPGMQYKLKGLD